MPKTNVYDMSGKQVGEIELSEALFGIEPNQSVVHDVVKNHLANCRRGWTSAAPSLGCTCGRWPCRCGCPSPRLVRLPSCAPEPAPNSSAASERSTAIS